ncbi:hypothetical protein BCL69_102226 [Nitrosomonas communis]|uniref:Uncharacterized protein n=1 Tax=Nitrosomonas communis TaxID=44574 RepID=A0A5D3YEL3_9PROT|nr:hypothetical protein BCL69_102226 [Nitrosomonas communis]
MAARENDGAAKLMISSLAKIGLITNQFRSIGFFYKASFNSEIRQCNDKVFIHLYQPTYQIASFLFLYLSSGFTILIINTAPAPLIK